MMNRPWSPEEDKRLLSLHSQGFIFKYIGERLDRSRQSVRSRFRFLKMSEDERDRFRFNKNQERLGRRALPPGERKRQFWTAQETELAEKLIAENASEATFKSLIGRTKKACRERFMRIANRAKGHTNASGHYVNSIPATIVPPQVLDDRNRRLMARMQMDLTAQICGDPENCRRRL